MGSETKSQMEAEEAFKLDVVRVKLVKEAPLYSELPLQNPYEAAATIGELLCEMDREVVCVVNLQSDLKHWCIRGKYSRQAFYQMQRVLCSFIRIQAEICFRVKKIR